MELTVEVHVRLDVAIMIAISQTGDALVLLVLRDMLGTRVNSA